jgi:uncharacterized membrane protein YwaF
MKKTLLYVAGTLILLWGVSHLFPTANVVRDFGNISFNNKMIIKMEWITEGMVLIFLGLLTVIVTKIETQSKLSGIVLLSIAAMLLSMAVLSLFTGFRVDFLPFKLCPLIFSVSAILILFGIKSKSMGFD